MLRHPLGAEMVVLVGCEVTGETFSLVLGVASTFLSTGFGRSSAARRCTGVVGGGFGGSLGIEGTLRSAVEAC